MEPPTPLNPLRPQDLHHPSGVKYRFYNGAGNSQPGAWLAPGFLPGPLRLLMLPSSQLEAEVKAKNEEDVDLSVEWIQDFLQHRNQMLE